MGRLLAKRNESLKLLYLRTGHLADQQGPADLITSPSIHQQIAWVEDSFQGPASRRSTLQSCATPPTPSHPGGMLQPNPAMVTNGGRSGKAWDGPI